MRTTLDLDDDVLQAARELARREKSTAGRVISELARRGLSLSGKTRRPTATRNGVPVLRPRGEIVTLDKVRRLMDDEGI